MTWLYRRPNGRSYTAWVQEIKRENLQVQYSPGTFHMLSWALAKRKCCSLIIFELVFTCCPKPISKKVGKQCSAGFSKGANTLHCCQHLLRCTSTSMHIWAIQRKVIGNSYTLNILHFWTDLGYFILLTLPIKRVRRLACNVVQCYYN